MTSPQEHVDRLRKEAAAAAAEAEREADKVSRLGAAFPDLRRYVGRWNKVAYCSKAVNGRVDKYDMRRNCGCCPDSLLEIWPFAETLDGDVYSDPPMFFVGRSRVWGSGYDPDPGWEEAMRKHGLPEALIADVALLFPKDEKEADDG